MKGNESKNLNRIDWNADWNAEWNGHKHAVHAI